MITPRTASKTAAATAAAAAAAGRGRAGASIHVGTSGWLYPAWRGRFYPTGLPHRRELEYLSRRMGSAEINGSFYSLQRPERYQSWRAQTPDDFVFAVKGSRFITHMKRLRDVVTPLANFLASGVLALGPKLGPVLWQLPPNLAFEPDRLAEFFAILPRDTRAAAELAQQHDQRVGDWAWTTTEANRPLRHALEVRHPSYRSPEFVELLRSHGIALVVADTAGIWPLLDDVTADFVYVRLHGAEELYASGYTAQALSTWAQRIRAWHTGEAPRSEHTAGTHTAPSRPEGRDVYVYFDNDAKVKAPGDAIALARQLGVDRDPGAVGG